MNATALLDRYEELAKINHSAVARGGPVTPEGLKVISDMRELEAGIDQRLLTARLLPHVIIPATIYWEFTRHWDGVTSLDDIPTDATELCRELRRAGDRIFRADHLGHRGVGVALARVASDRIAAEKFASFDDDETQNDNAVIAKSLKFALAALG